MNMQPIEPERRKLCINGVKAATLALGIGAGRSIRGSEDPESKPLRLGIIGLGDRGLVHMMAIKVVRGLDLKAFCDISSTKLNRAKALHWTGKTYNDYRDLLDDPNIDAVTIATPLKDHFKMAVDALAAGKHVFCEKTMTYSIAEAKDLVSIVNASDLTFQTGYQYPYNYIFQKARKLIQDGEIGKITNVSCQWNRNSDWRKRVGKSESERLIHWRLYREYSKGLMGELGSHHMDYLCSVLGEYPSVAMGMGGVNYWRDGRETYDNIMTMFNFKSGIKASFTALTANSYNGFDISFKGDLGTLTLTNNKAYLSRESGSRMVDAFSGATSTSTTCRGQEIKGKLFAEATVASFSEFRDSIRTGAMPIANVKRGADSVVVVNMAVEAMLTGRPQEWQDNYNTELL